MANVPQKTKPKILFKVDGQYVYRGSSLGRFLYRARQLNRQNRHVYSIRISYPDTGWYNEGEYRTLRDFWHAFGAFTEDYYPGVKEVIAVNRQMARRYGYVTL